MRLLTYSLSCTESDRPKPVNFSEVLEATGYMKVDPLVNEYNEEREEFLGSEAALT